MFFKKLEINGFKSFSSKTEVEFKPGVNVIVGPNGSGKSNILDSIRWVLGEQKASSLRSKTMDDVIFNGNATKKPAGMAHVSITVSNDNKIIPIDYNEVNFARRLFRTGESEYLLNKVNCRLKDISELTMDTGIGTDSYSILEQGKVDEIINAKPLERRYIFDEAAGITKYKTRREEALRKLKRTREDLLRLTDVIAEVKKNMSNLKRQASKAQQYKDLVEELNVLEKQLLVLRFNQFQKEYSELDKRLTSQKDKYQQMVTRSDSLSAQISEEERRLEELNHQVSGTLSEYNKLNTHIEQEKSNVGLLQERISNFQNRKENLKQDLNVDKIKIDHLASEEKQVIAELDVFTKRLAKLEEQYAQKSNEYEMLKKSIDANARKRTELNDLLYKTNSQIIKIEGDVKVSESKIETIQNEMSSDSNQIKELEEICAGYKNQLDNEQTNLDKIKDSLSKKQNEYDDAKNEILGLESSIIKMSKDLHDLSAKLQDNRSRFNALKTLQQNYEGYYSGVREVMKASKEKKLNGIKGVVANLITTKAEYELAIEVALGANIQNIVVDTAANAKESVEYLKKTGAGRATFIPLDLISARETTDNLKQILSNKGVIGLAMEIVDYDKDIKEAVKYLLGHMVVVENIDVALTLEKKGHRANYVSLDGDFVNPGGAITGGSRKSTGLLSREREIKELSNSITKLEKETIHLNDQIIKDRRKLENLALRKDLLYDEIHQVKIELNTHEKEYEKIQSDFNLHNKSLMQFSNKISTLNIELENAKKDISNRSEEINHLSEQKKNYEAEFNSLHDASSGENQKADELGKEVNELLLESTSFKERKRSFQDRLTNIQSSISELTKQSELRQNESQSIDNEVAKAKDGLEESKIILKELTENKNQFEGIIKDHQVKRDGLEVSIRELRNELQIINRDRNISQNDLHEEELNKAQLESKLENIRAQADEKFRTTYEEVAASVGEFEADHDNLISNIGKLKQKVESIGPVNVLAIEEYEEQKERFEFLSEQEKDLTEAEQTLSKTIKKIDETTKQMFEESFEKIRQNFIEMFRRLFRGGKADLVLLEPDNINESGIDIVAQPPGKKLQNINLLSGGEKALTAIALLFGIFLVKPSPFCVLDEIDAPLDDANIERFKNLIREFSGKVQFLIITHNKQTMELADVIYGVTMEEPGVSKLVSVEFDKIDESKLLD